MSILVIEGDKNITLRSFLWDSHLRLQSNPFVNGSIKKLEGEDKDSYVLSIDPLIPRFYLIGPFMVAAVLFFTGLRLSWWLAPGIALTLSGFFWSTPFMYLGLRLGLRKQGYNGTVRRIRKDEGFKRVINKLL